MNNTDTIFGFQIWYIVNLKTLPTLKRRYEKRPICRTCLAKGPYWTTVAISQRNTTRRELQIQHIRSSSLPKKFALSQQLEKMATIELARSSLLSFSLKSHRKRLSFFLRAIEDHCLFSYSPSVANGWTFPPIMLGHLIHNTILGKWT